MAAPRLRLRRGTSAPSGSNFLAGEPLFDSTNENLYLATSASAVALIGGSTYSSRVDEFLTAGASTASGIVTIKSRNDESGGGQVNFDVADTANTSTYTWPDAPGATSVLQSDTNGDFVWVPQLSISGESYITAGGTGNQTLTLAKINLASQVTGTLPIANGGTGATTESDARTNLGLAIGTDVQAYDAGLTDIAGLAVTDGNIIVGDGSNWVAESGATARTSLGVAIGTDVQAYDAGLTDIAGLDVTDGNIIVGDGSNWVAESGATARASLGAQAADAGLTDIAGLDVTDGNIIVGDGSNWVAESGATARTSLGVAIGTDVQAYDDGLNDIAGLAQTDGNIIVGNGSKWVAESGATARTSLGLTIGTDVQAYDAELAAIAGLTSAANKVPYFTGSGTAAVADLSAYGRTLIDDADAAGARTTLGLDALYTAGTATVSAKIILKSRTSTEQGSGGGQVEFDVAHTSNTSTYTWPDAPSGNRILQSDANGDLSWVTQTSGYSGWTISDGTNSSTLSSAETLTGSGSDGVTFEVTANGDAFAVKGSGHVATIAGLTATDGGVIIGDGTNFVVESGATARTSLGLGTGNNVEFTDLTVSGNLTVSGTTTTVSTTNTVISDSLIELANGTTGTPGATADAGIVVERGDQLNIFFGFDEGSDVFVAGTTQATGSSADTASTPISFLALGYNVSDTAGTNETVVGYLAAASAPDGATAGRYLQNITIDAGTY